MQQRLKHGQVVAQALAACRRRGHDDILAAAQRVDGVRLVRVQIINAGVRERAFEAWIKRPVQHAVAGIARRHIFAVRDLLHVPRHLLYSVQERCDIHV